MIGEIKYEIWPPRKTGGQYVGTGPNGVRGVHFINGFPTGIEAICEYERSQFKNRQIVTEMIEWAISNLKINPILDHADPSHT